MVSAPPTVEALVLPASRAQERIWFLEHVGREDSSHHIALAFELAGRLDHSRLASALLALARRHEAIRTCFADRDGIPVQVVLSEVDVPLRIVTADPADEAAVAAMLGTEAARPFDLRQAPLLRALLISLSPERHLFQLTIHHIVADGWSMGIITEELAKFYRGEGDTLPQLPLQYAEAARWQDQRLTPAARAATLAFWREQLDMSEPLRLEGDKPRDLVRDTRGGQRTFRLDAEFSRRLLALARSMRSTPFVLMLTAFQVLLSRYSGRDDIAVGTPIAERSRVELEGIVGLFVNTVVIRTSLRGDPSFRDLVDRTREAVLATYEHSALPFEQLVEELQPRRDLGTTPIFQVMFAWQERGATLDLAGAVATRRAVAIGATKFDLTLEMMRDRDGLYGQIDYSTALFDADKIEGMLRHFRCLLEGVAADAGTVLSRLPLMDHAERTALLAQWSRPAAPASKDDLCSLFAAVARDHATRIAVEDGDVRLDYAELEDRSARLAAELRNRGVGPEVRVGLCLPPSSDLLVAILGILRAGGAYVPLDPMLPDGRLLFMAGDAGVALVLADADGAARPAAFGAVPIVRIDAPGWRERPPIAPADPVHHADQLAYILYTSGSTGAPKGVAVTHRNVVRLFAVTRGWGGFGPEDVWSLFHAAGFDFSVWEMWGAWLFGGRLVVVPYWVRRSPADFHALLRDRGVTILSQTPSAFRQLRALAPDWSALDLRMIVFGGEELRYEELAGWQAPCIRLVNMYGITETTVHVTRCEISGEELAGARGSAIGLPLDDLCLYVLDAAMQPVPVGVPGEIFVGGPGLARGYAGRPGLTAARFVPDPFASEPGARLYRSGDLARPLPDGGFAYAGRADRQVKVRGHRIELGEIEAALLGAGLAEAVVEHQRDQAGLDRLVAYVVGDPQAADTLRAVLATRLPAYMLPAAYIWLDRLPLTPHGKVDRRALPPPPEYRPALATAYQAPRTPAETVLATIWQTVLRSERVGIHDNFFSLGGDSIRSLQVQAIAGRQNIHFTLEQIFQNPTVESLAAVARHQPSSTFSRTRPFELAPKDATFPDTIEDAYPLTALQAGMLFHTTLAPNSRLYHNTGGRHISLAFPFDETAFRAAVCELVRNHAVFRTSFDFHTFDEPLQLVHRGAELPLTVIDIRHLTTEEQEKELDTLLASELTRPFDLSKPTLLRFFVHLRSDRSIQFSITECHAIYDGWSYHSTVVELFNTYARLARGQPPVPAPELALTFRDFVALERAAIDDPAERGFWNDVLEDAVVTRLPQALPTSSQASISIRPLYVTLKPATSARLQRLARTHGLPLKSLLLAAHVKAIGLLAGTNQVLTGLVANGRPDVPDADRLFGLFLNSIPFPLALKRDRWIDLVQATYELEGKLMAHRRLPLTAIQAVAGIRGICDETLFNYLDFHVYEQLDPALGFKILGGNNAEGSNILLTAHFQRRTLVSGLKTDILLLLDYDSARLAEAHAEQIRNVYVNVLDAMAEGFLDCHDNPLLAGSGSIDGPAFSPSKNNLIGRIIDHARHQPRRMAVRCQDHAWTYAELERRTATLAQTLRDHGFAPETRVAVCLEADPDFVAALLACWSIGVTFVPLDPSHPPERLRRLVALSSIRAVLTTGPLLQRIDFGDVLSVPLNEVATNAAAPPLADCADLPGTLLGYSIATSGSTGLPKQCDVARGAFEALISWYGREIAQTGAPVALIVSSIGFDLTLKNIFAPLTVGGSIELLVPPFDAQRICDTIVRREITLINCAPTAFYAILDAAAAAEYRPLAGLRELVLGGESVALSPLLAWHASGNCRTRIVNSYGPAECADVVAAGSIDLANDGTRGPVPIGTPLPGTTLLVLNDRLNPVPPGTPGQLCIGGAAVGRGYAADPRLTAARFVPDPNEMTAGSRLYLTGDRASIDGEGNIVILGRVDRQIKIRGYRVEQGEIESALESHASVRWAHVDVEPSTSGSGLTAYVLADDAPGLSAALRAWLRTRLPEFMVPEAILTIESLPRNANGKIDLAGLRAGCAPFPLTRPPAAMIRGASEELIAAEWRHALHHDTFGSDDAFFDVGGNSLTLLQVHQRLQQRLGRQIPFIDLFAHPTIRTLASYFDSGRGEEMPDEQSTSSTAARRRQLAGRGRQAKPTIEREQA